MTPALPARPRHLARCLPVALGMLGACSAPLRAETLPALLDEAVDRGLPGIVIVVRSGAGDQDFDGAAGWADVDGRVPMAPDTGFRIASNSKAFVGLTLALLAHDGDVDLDAPLGASLPAATLADIENAEAATLRQALQHTSGIAEYMDDDAFWDAVEAGRSSPWTLDEALDHARGLPATAPVGQGWSYSNTNYLLAGAVLEATTGGGWGAAVRERVLDPVGMTSSFVENEEEARVPIAHGYSRATDDMYAVDTGYGLPDGGIVATAPELAAFLRAVGGGPAPSAWAPEAVAATLTPAATSDQGEQYGLGLAAYETPCGRTIGHGGGLEGYLSEMFHVPDRDLTVIVFVNASDGWVDRVFGEVVERALEVVCG